MCVCKFLDQIMMTSSNGNIFRVTGPFCGEISGHRWIPRTKASDAELWCFLWTAHWINSWVNNRGVGDWVRHCVHYDVIVLSRDLIGPQDLGTLAAFQVAWCILHFAFTNHQSCDHRNRNSLLTHFRPQAPTGDISHEYTIDIDKTLKQLQ